MTKTIDRLESEVRSYVRSFPTVFTKAEGSILTDEKGTEYIDFFAGAGALNYGHNEPHLRDALIEYLGSMGVTHGLDMATGAKIEFLEAFEKYILKPREMDFKVMFPGPTGTNAVEAAVKLARKVTDRTTIVAFTNAFHGMTLGSLALTGNEGKRHGAGMDLHGTTRLPFDGYMGEDTDTLDYMEAVLADPSSGIDAPAAFIVETIQGEGGVNVASRAWLERLGRIAKRHGSMLIIDDIQVGCGRTGTFFSFEDYDIQPDIICLSKSISGYGLPFALTLIRPGIDTWKPGEHNGTFRGNNLAFVTATKALERYWADDTLSKAVAKKAELVTERLTGIANRFDGVARGRGLMQGLAFDDNPDIAGTASKIAFEHGLIIETSGAHGEVLKLLPALTISEKELERGLDILEKAVEEAVKQHRKPSEGLTASSDPMSPEIQS
jgi:diaminobutyrate-2-oxoglutarate transaminase